MKKNILIFILTIVFTIFGLNIVNSSNNVVGPYSTLLECNEIRDKNNNNTIASYQKYERSKCYKNEGKFQYNICKKGEGCINNTFSKDSNVTNNILGKSENNEKNPYSDKIINIKGRTGTIESFFGKKMDTLIQKLKGKDSKINSVKKLISFKDKLTKIGNQSKFKNNKLIQNLVGYIQFEILEEVSRLKREIAIEEENNGLDDFICELEGTCKDEEKPRHICTREYKPVCAIINNTKKTYSNSCTAKAAGAKFLSNGKCEDKKEFKIGKIENNYKYLKINYSYQDEVLFKYGYDSKHIFKFTNKGDKIELGDNYKYKVIPGKEYTYYFYNAKTGKYLGAKGSFVAKDIEQVKCGDLNGTKLSSLPKKGSKGLCENGKNDWIGADYPGYYWSCIGKNQKKVYCKAKMSKE